MLGVNEDIVSLDRYWDNVWFRQSFRYDGATTRNNSHYVRERDGERQEMSYSTRTAKAGVRLLIRPLGWGSGPSHRFSFDWIAVRSYALPDVTGTIGEEVDANQPTEADILLAKSQALYKECCDRVDKKRDEAREACRQSASDEVRQMKDLIKGLKSRIRKLYVQERTYVTAVSKRKARQQRQAAQRTLNKLNQSIQTVTKDARAAMDLITKKAAAKKKALQAVLLGHKKLIDAKDKLTEEQMKADYERVLPAEAAKNRDPSKKD